MSTVHLYAPNRRSAEELRSTFVARQALLEELLASLDAQATRQTHQHHLLVGPRGIGKSHMLAMIRLHLEEEPRCRGPWLPLLLGQEGYGVQRLRQWVEQWVRAAVEAYFERGLDASRLELVAGEVARLPDDEALPRLLAALRDAAEAHERKHLLLAENLDRVLGERLLQEQRAANRLRELLQHDPTLLLVGSSPTFFAQLKRGAEPMYELFQVHRLEDLSRDEMVRMLERRAVWDRQQRELTERAGRVLDVLQGQPGRITMLHQLTGGNPRFVEMLYRLICSARSAAPIEGEFLHLLEELTPYFQQRTAQLTPQQEEIFVALVRAGYQTTPTRLAEATATAVNTVTRQLGRLEELGFVARQGRRGKSTLYALRERLYRYWLQYHEQPTEKLVRLIVDFLSAWYTRDELSVEHGQLRTAAALAASEPERQELAICCHYLEAALSQQEAAGPAAQELSTLPELELLLAQLRRATSSEASRELWRLVARAPARRRSVLLRWATAVAQRYAASGEEADFAEASRLFEEWCGGLGEGARQGKPRDPEPAADGWQNWGTMLTLRWQTTGRNEDFAAAAERYRRAVEIRPELHEAWSNWANMLSSRWEKTGDLGDFAASAEHYQRAVEIRPELHGAWYNWANMLSRRWKKTGDPEDFAAAAERYRRAVEIRPELHEAWNNWANLLACRWKETGDPADFFAARERFARAAELEPGAADTWFNGGQLSFLRWQQERRAADGEMARGWLESCLACAPPVEDRAFRCRAAAMLAALDGGSPQQLGRWRGEVLAVDDAGGQAAAVLGTLELLARHVPLARLEEALREIAAAEQVESVQSWLAPLLDALAVLQGAEVSRLDRYPPELTSVLQQIFPTLPRLATERSAG